jgi:Ner family transcriptional regulator
MNADDTHKPVAQDWPRSKIKMHLEDAGWSLRRLSVAYGRSPCAASQALHQPTSPPVEQIIATAIDKKPEEIWPSRYPGGVRAPSYTLNRASKKSSTARRPIYRSGEKQ